MAAVRLIVARCEVVYTGRLTAVLPEALGLRRIVSTPCRRSGRGVRRAGSSALAVLPGGR